MKNNSKNVLHNIPLVVFILEFFKKRCLSGNVDVDGKKFN